MTYSDGTVITYTYDDAGNRTGMEVTAGNKIIQVTDPNGGEEWPIGSSQTITWNSANVTGNVNILLSRNNGTTWETLFANTDNDGNESWTITGETSDQCLIRLVSIDFGNVYDVSDGTFSITPQLQDSITVTSPNGSETWEIGSSHNITWTSTESVGNVKIEYSTDYGSTWNEIIASTINDGTHPWTIPAPQSNQCLVRVSETDGTPSDISNIPFSIFLPSAPGITVTSPNGGETLEPGSTYDITWNTTGIVGDVKIEYSINNGSSWEIVTDTTPNDDVYPWTVPDTESAECLIRVSEASDGDPLDTSDSIFSIQTQPIYGSLERVSVSSDEIEGDEHSYRPSVSAHGRFVAFHSKANNLVNGEPNLYDEVFVRDRWSGQTTLVSVATDGTPGVGRSRFPSISADGRYVAFQSQANNLVEGDNNGKEDIFVHDRETGETQRVSVATPGMGGESDDNSWNPAISGNGRYVAFHSYAHNLVDIDNGYSHVYVYDRETSTTTRVSVRAVTANGIPGNNHSYYASISADGRFVAFQSQADNLVDGDTNGMNDIFVHDRQLFTTTRVSVASDGTQSNNESYQPSISADGRYVIFYSLADTLVVNDTNNCGDIFVRDLLENTTVRVSVHSDGTQGNNGSLWPASISGDGRYAAFYSGATNLISSNDVNGPTSDIFIRDCSENITRLVSITSDGIQADQGSYYPSISADGNYIAFQSDSTNLVSNDNNNFTDIFVSDFSTINNNFILTVQSSPDTGAPITITPEDNALMGDGNTNFTRTYDPGTGVTLTAPLFHLGKEFIKWTIDGVDNTNQTIQLTMDIDHKVEAVYQNFASPVTLTVQSPSNPGVPIAVSPDDSSGDGDGNAPFTRIYPWNTTVTLTAPWSFNGSKFVKWMIDGTDNLEMVINITLDKSQTAEAVYQQFPDSLERVSLDSSGTEANDISIYSAISGDGRYVAFYSAATNLVPGDTNGKEDIFVRDRNTGQTTRVSVSSNGTQADDKSGNVAISGDGRYVAFESYATNLVDDDTNGQIDIFVHDRQTGETTRVSVGTGNIQGNSYSDSPSISADGDFVAFTSMASNFIAGDTNGDRDIFVHHRQTGETKCVSIASDGIIGDMDSLGPSISADGRYIAFASHATNFVQDELYGMPNIYVHDSQTGQTNRVSLGFEWNYSFSSPSISGDGRYVSFTAEYSTIKQIYVRDRQNSQTTHVSVASDGTPANSYCHTSKISGDGGYVTFDSFADNLVENDINGIRDVFVHDVERSETSLVSISLDGLGGNNISASPAISQDGKCISFYSSATNLVINDTNSTADIFVYNGPPTIETHTLSVQSSPDQGIPITVSPLDNDGNGDGNTNFSRTYNAWTVVNLTAPATHNGKEFEKWLIDSTENTNQSIEITMDTNHTVEAVYITPATLTVTSPNGGETWESGSIHEITWDTTGSVGNLKIQYSINNGTNWSTIVDSTENDGSHLWTVPDEPSNQCLVRIGEIDGDPVDVSDGPFSIVPQPIISGTVTFGGSGLENVVMNGLPGNPTTNSQGFYTTPVNYGWSGTVTPTLAGYAFTEPSTTYTNVTADQSTNYSAALIIPTVERNAIIDLYNSTNGDTWTDNSGWKTPPLHTDGFAMPGTEGNWFGITVENGRVLRIKLFENNLVGTIPSSLENLTALRELHLYGNQLTGSIPPSIGNLSNLVILDFNLNLLSGTIPLELANLANLEYLKLYSNQLTGEIPGELGNLSKLVTLTLGRNQLTGSIPDSLGSLSSLVGINLSYNQLNGSIPPSLGQLINLRYLNLHVNELSGTIPAEVGSLTNLVELRLHTNQLTESIPPSIGNLSNLVILDLNLNNLSGSIPLELANLTNLEDLKLYNNQLTGEIPGELGNLSKLVTLTLGRNQLTGSIPDSLGSLSSLIGLNLSYNQLTGSIPSTMEQLTTIRYLNLHVNELSGAVPAWLGSLTNLVELRLHTNQFTGEIPTTFGNFSKLTLLHLGKNQLSGSIPVEIANLSKLEQLYLYENQLTGEIPPELGNLSNLLRLDIFGNQFTGSIPPELGGLLNLKYLHLYDNKLTGNIPHELGNLINLINLKLKGNQLTGSIPASLINLTSLSDSNTDIGFNALYTDNVELKGFLSSKDPDWEATQTIAPIGVTASVLSSSSVEVSWTPITYTEDPGGYRVSYSTTAGGAYTLFDTTTDKTVSSMIVTGLTPATTHYFVVQTRTEPHNSNQNTVDSENSEEVSAATLPMPEITVISPNGGETLTTGSIYEITWTSIQVGNSVIIQYYNGNFWETITPNTDNTGSYNWTVPNNPSDNCLVRVSGGYADDAPSDISDAVFSIASSPLPALKITSPNGGETLIAGSPYEITWNSNGAVGDVKLEYSIDNGVSWIIIVPSMDNNGSFHWTVPDTPSESCLVRVGESDKDIGISDVSDGGFSIVSAPFITVISPNGGENWEVGATHSINWTSTGIDGNVKIEYSTTNGTSWTPVVESTDNTGIFNWTVPGTPAENCLIKISDIDGEPVDVSDTVFSIISPPSLTVTSPNGGENWNAGSTHNITWTSSGNVGQLNIEYSIDNGGSWITIATSVDNNGGYSWIVPDNSSENCLVRISEADSDSSISDVSDAVFSIVPGPVLTVTSPNGGERLEVNTAHQITWNSSGTIGEINIEYSTDNGSSWAVIVNSTANDGSYSWTVPDNPSKSCLIRISETDGEPADISDAVFSIVSPSSSTITITSPNGGESLTIDTTHEITWTSTGMEENEKVMIEYSPDNGGCWLNIVPAAANTGSNTWTVPDNPSENCLIRIAGSDSDEGPSDTSDEPFAIVPPSSPTITVISPNGGETLISDSTHEITWTCSGMENVENVVIECSTDSGANWTTIAFSTSDMGSFNWTVPDNPSDNCLVRIRLSDMDEGPSDTSDEVFTIISAPVITVTSPNGGEQWKIGSIYNITWSSTGITGDIFIDLYRGTSFDLNIGSASVETGSFAWNIPTNFTIGNDYKIFLHKDSAEDYSDGEFSIIDQEPNQPDFNNDGHVDILWRNYATGNNEVWLMNGSIRTETSSLPAMPDLNWRIVGTGDFNRDGKVDILWRNYANGQNLVWYMDGTTQTGFEYLLNQPDVNCQIAGTGDFNSDGNVDILWRNPLEGRNQVWYMDGVNVKGYQGLQSLAGIQWRVGGIGDFNGDSHVDILWRNYSTGSNEVWYMNGASRISTAAVLEMSDLNWRMVGTGDFNRDGELDVLWRNYSNGTNMTWYMNGITRTGYEYIETRSDLNWRIMGNGDYRD